MTSRITPSQARAARALLRLSQSEAADLIGMSRQQYQAFESRSDDDGRMLKRNNEALIAAFEERGVVLIEPGPRWGAGVMWASEDDAKRADQ